MTRAGGRLYWICQAAGWGSFMVYVLIAYIATTSPPRRGWDIVSIIFFNGVVCPVLTHGLRHRMLTHGWLELPGWRLFWRCAAFVSVSAWMLAAAVGLLAVAVRGASHPIPMAGLAGVLAGFTWALTGWVTIYYVVHVRRRRDALQLELKMAAREAELRALKAQVNPHFLFNCLNSLRHLIGSEPEKAQAMLTSLADLLRYSLESNRQDLVPLRDELVIVDEYLELERVRFDERLRVERAIDPAALAVPVPPMLAQTLVDNAIKHGIADLTSGGVVRLEATVSDSRLNLSVWNTGALKRSTGENGSGLRNARERLRLLFGAEATLDLRDVNGMTRASVQIPTHRAAAD